MTEPPALWRHPAFGVTLALATLAAVGLWFGWRDLSLLFGDLEERLTQLLPKEWIASAGWALLPAIGFGAGLLSSLSPCVLPLVPLQVAAIGASGASGARAVWLSASFVAGAAVVLSLLGLASGLTGWLLIEQRGPVLFSVGAAVVYGGLASLEVAPVPFAGRIAGSGRALGPFLAGAAFALVTTPCASPLLAGLLAAAAASALPGIAVVTMFGFALGYTALVFVSGAMTGAFQARLSGRVFAGARAAASALLLVAGTGFAASGIAWYL